MCSFEGVDAGGRAGGGEADTEQAERKRCGRGEAERQGKQSQRSGSEARARAKAKQEQSGSKAKARAEAKHKPERKQSGRRQPKISGGNGWRDHLFPSRTQKLSLHALMVLGWTRPGRVGRCRNPVYGEGNFSV